MRIYSVFKSTVFTITTALLFFFWGLLSTIFKDNYIYGILLASLISVGTYRSVSKIMEVLLFKIVWIKKKVFGSSFLEGIWIGCYRGIDEKPNYYIEYFEQSFDGLVIRGKCFSSNLQYKGCWISDRVIIDETKGVITYTYETDMISSTHKNQGLASFNFERNNALDYPEKLFGFSSDIFATQKLLSLEIKVDAKNKKSEQELIADAKALYTENLHYFQSIVL